MTRTYDKLVIATSDGRETAVMFDGIEWTDHVAMVRAAWSEIDAQQSRTPIYVDEYGHSVMFFKRHIVSLRSC